MVLAILLESYLGFWLLLNAALKKLEKKKKKSTNNSKKRYEQTHMRIKTIDNARSAREFWLSFADLSISSDILVTNPLIQRHM